MDFSYVEEIENAVVVKNVQNFNLKHIFDCGQCFRWSIQKDGSYIGVAYGKVIRVEMNENNLYIYNSNLSDVESIWIDYFDLNRDYSLIKNELSKDVILKPAVEFGHGIRILKQEPFEIIISFIISANNRIPMIKKCINNICRLFGNEIIYEDKIYYSFPTVEELNKANIHDLEGCGTGFRAKYIKDTVEKIYTNIYGEEFSEGFDIKWITAQEDEKCYLALQKFLGVGPKVADCIMLFSMNKYYSFPVDVWVKRAMQHFYVAPDVSLKKIRKFGIDKFAGLSGFAQQYLFYYARENKIEVNN